MADTIIDMEFIETPTFSRAVCELMDDDEYRAAQNRLIDTPACGDLIQGGGGIRKLRVAALGRGKSGGVRFIYYWKKNEYQIYMLLAYSKSRKDSLTEQETAILRDLVKEL